MPETQVRFYCDDDGSAPVLQWLDDLAERDRRAYLKCRELIGRLAQFGHELRRPSADLLSDGIYELRARVGRLNYRVLYFFHGRDIAVLAHAMTKEREVPKADLLRAINRKVRFEADPDCHTYQQST